MIELDPAALTYLAAGLATLLAAVLPRLLHAAPISMPMLFVAVGMVAFALIADLPDPDPLAHPVITLHLTELCVIVSLMGAGLAINRRLGARRWSSTWRLLGITMPLTMIAVGFLGWTMLGLGAAATVLIAAVLAPTDPVLASEVQVSEPAADPDHDDDETRFALTSEAGLNDGLAFLFTWAAVGIAVAGIDPAGWLGHWLVVDLGWRLAAGIGVGFACGWGLARLLFAAPSARLRVTTGAHGFVALAATFLAYGLAELVHGYGFIAVFVAAVTLRAHARHHHFMRVLHSFVEQVERLLTVAVLVLVGGAVSRGALEGIGVAEVAFVIIGLVVIRPLAGWIGLARGATGGHERMVIAFFGVRGVGSLFYLAFALQEAEFPGAQRLWAIVMLTVVASVVLHGITATPVMRALDRHRGRTPEGSGSPAAAAD